MFLYVGIYVRILIFYLVMYVCKYVFVWSITMPMHNIYWNKQYVYMIDFIK